tara:strand:- start:1638 stop:1895 length:258 start_codon:yes stop_codon:yes gene_type:complete
MALNGERRIAMSKIVAERKPVKAFAGAFIRLLGLGGRKSIRMVKPDIIAHYKKKDAVKHAFKNRGQLKNLKLKDYKNPSMKVVKE